MDYFTKWLEAYALPSQEALTVVEALVTNFFRCIRVLRELQSDQGRNFKPYIMQVLQCLGVRKIYTNPLHPQLDSTAQQYVNTVMEHL
jgi:hypothetical protein